MAFQPFVHRPTAVLPTLPTRDILLRWLSDPRLPDEQRPRLFSLNGEKDDPPDPIAFWLQAAYPLHDVVADGWSIYRGRLRDGTVFVFDAEDHPPAAAVVLAMRIVHGEMMMQQPGAGRAGVVTRDELIYLLDHWENPHEAADSIINARRLSSSGTEGRSVGSG